MNKTRIAIVEDDADDREFISTSLAATADIELSVYENGSDFLEFIQNTETCPDLIITDLRMPLVSGFDVIQAIKESAKTKDIPVVVLSTSSNNDDISRAKQLGAAAFYVKPYNLSAYAEITIAIVESLRNNLLRFSTIVKKIIKPGSFDPAWIS
jgi:CheY-like chemotaxis protein